MSGKNHWRIWVVGTLGATAVLVVGLAARLAADSLHGTPDRDISLLKSSVFGVPSPEPVTPAGGEPGDDPVLPRAFPGEPALVPHEITDFLPITREENQCIDCHAVAEKVEGEPTPIPEGHYVDLRRSPQERRDRVAGARYVCISCHVPQTTATPLIPNP